MRCARRPSASAWRKRWRESASWPSPAVAIRSCGCERQRLAQDPFGLRVVRRVARLADALLVGEAERVERLHVARIRPQLGLQAGDLRLRCRRRRSPSAAPPRRRSGDTSPADADAGRAVEHAAEGEDGGGRSRRHPCDEKPSRHYGVRRVGDALRVVEAAERRRHVREDVQVRHVVRVDAVTERQAVADQHAADHTLGDVDDVVLEPPAVRIAGEVAADHAEPVDLVERRRRDRQVEPELVGERRPGVVQHRRLEAGAEHLRRGPARFVSWNGPNCGYSFCSTVARIGFA